MTGIMPGILAKYDARIAELEGAWRRGLPTSVLPGEVV
jgi:hypothetical protein